MVYLGNKLLNGMNSCLVIGFEKLGLGILISSARSLMSGLLTEMLGALGLGYGFHDIY